MSFSLAEPGRLHSQRSLEPSFWRSLEPGASIFFSEAWSPHIALSLDALEGSIHSFSCEYLQLRKALLQLRYISPFPPFQPTGPGLVGASKLRICLRPTSFPRPEFKKVRT